MATPSVTTELRLPIEQYLLTPAQHSEIEHATAVLTRACMQRYGYAFDVAPMLTHQRSGGQIDKRYGPSLLSQVQEYGYHDSPNPDKDLPRPTAVSSFPDAERLLLTGRSPNGQAGEGLKLPSGATVPQGGCAGEAQRKIVGGEQSGSSDLAQQIDTASYSISARAPQVVAAESAWSACMKDRGYSYGSHVDAYNDDRWGKSRSAESLEISVAVADVECKQRTNFIGIWYSVESAFQQRQIDQNRDKLESLRGQLGRQLSAAAETNGSARP